MYYSYIEIEYVATSFSPTITDLAVKLLMSWWPFCRWPEVECSIVSPLWTEEPHSNRHYQYSLWYLSQTNLPFVWDQRILSKGSCGLDGFRSQRILRWNDGPWTILAPERHMKVNQAILPDDSQHIAVNQFLERWVWQWIYNNFAHGDQAKPCLQTR
jgi:hypothetical protein